MLDTSALLDAGEGRSQYFRALIVTATTFGTTLVIPTTAWAEAWALSHRPSRPFLDLMASHPQVVFEPLDVESGRAVGLNAPWTSAHGIEWSLTASHVATIAVRRGYPVVTRNPGPLLQLDIGVAIEPLP